MIFDDKYFGTINTIDYHNDDIQSYADCFFEKSVNIEYIKYVEENGDIFIVNGLINLDGLRIPFTYEKSHKSFSKSSVYSMRFSFFSSVVYTKNKDFSDNFYYAIDISGSYGHQYFLKESNAFDYINELIIKLPIKYSENLKFGLEKIFFYPTIDSKNGKNFKFTLDMIKCNFDIFVTHYQNVSEKRSGRNIYHYDGTTIYSEGKSFSSISVNNTDNIWKNIAIGETNYKEISDIMTGDYFTYNEYISDLENSLEVVKMIKI